MNDLTVRKKFSKKFKQLRKSAKLSQEVLATSFGLAQSAISKIENGERESLNIIELHILRNQYNFDLNELFDDRIISSDLLTKKEADRTNDLIESKNEIIALLKQKIEHLERQLEK